MISKWILSCYGIWELYPRDNILMGSVNLCKGHMTQELKYFEAEHATQDLQLVAFGSE